VNTTRSHIFMLPSVDFVQGACDVCGATVTLKFRDAATGLRVGHCCMPDLLEADRALADSPSYRHPSPR
jgi:hypothetical protein